MNKCQLCLNTILVLKKYKSDLYTDNKRPPVSQTLNSVNPQTPNEQLLCWVRPFELTCLDVH